MPIQASGTISISDLVTEFGGTAPHSLSEYYRSAGEVPNTKTTTDKAAASSSGTTSTDYESMDVDVTVDGSITGSYGDAVNVTYLGSGGDATAVRSIPSAYRNNGSVARFKATGTNYPPSGKGSYQWNGTGTKYEKSLADTWQEGIAIPSGATSVTLRIDSPEGSGGSTMEFALVSDSYELVITNDSTHTVNLTSSPWGNDATFTAGESKTVSDQSSNSWSWSHPAVTSDENINQDVPTSGTINLTDFYSAEDA